MSERFIGEGPIRLSEKSNLFSVCNWCPLKNNGPYRKHQHDKRANCSDDTVNTVCNRSVHTALTLDSRQGDFKGTATDGTTVVLTPKNTTTNNDTL